MRLLINAGVLQSEGGVALLIGLLTHMPAVFPDVEVLLYLNPKLAERLLGMDSLTLTMTKSAANAVARR